MKTYENFINNNPKIEYFNNGQKQSELWYLNDKHHREDGPSYQSWYSNGQKRYESWLLNGKLHREDGPAYQFWYSNGQKRIEEWWLNNKEYTREEWVDELKKIGSKHYREQKMLLNMENYNL
jgi:antitoxin component YwqK of YwqJK toxin-antitoxin module